MVVSSQTQYVQSLVPIDTCAPHVLTSSGSPADWPPRPSVESPASHSESVGMRQRVAITMGGATAGFRYYGWGYGWLQVLWVGLRLASGTMGGATAGFSSLCRGQNEAYDKL